jgi:chemotaxis protein methyltransferase CheR
VKQQGCENYHDLVRKVRAGIVPGLKEQIVDAVTTNETLWFRDSSPFEAMRYKLVPELIDQKAATVFPRRIRIWSAACSTGQEVYSIAITLAQTIPDFLDWDIQILGTDISPAAIEQASYGNYNKLEVSRGLSQELLDAYFIEQQSTWKVRDDIRSLCTFQQRNLMLPFDDLGPYDLIFCRNVAIYFSNEDRRRLFERAATSLAPNGWLFVGSSESLLDLGSRWKPEQHCRANCYCPNYCENAFD